MKTVLDKIPIIKKMSPGKKFMTNKGVQMRVVTKSKIIQIITIAVILLISANIEADDTRGYILYHPVNNLTERDIQLVRSWGRGYEPVQKTQPDGTEITLYESPDGHHKIKLTDENNYRVALSPKTWYYCWVMQDEDGGLYASQYPVHLHTPESLGLKPGLTETPEYNRRRYEDQEAAREIRKRENEEFRRWLFEQNPELYKRFAPGDTLGSIKNDGDTPHVGTVKSLVFFIIPDSSGSDFVRTWSEYDSVLNNMKGNSLRRFYKDVSNNVFDPISTIITTTSQTIVAYRDSLNSIDYYLKKSDDKEDGWEGNTERANRQKALVEQAVMYYLENIAMPSGLILNPNWVTLIDNAHIIFPAYTDGLIGNDIFDPHYINVGINVLCPGIGGIGSLGMMVTNEHMIFNGESPRGVGVIAHEFGHSLGLPDLYQRTETSTGNVDDSSIVWKFDLMCKDTNPPQSFSAYTIYQYLPGWLNVDGYEDIFEITETGTYTIKPLIGSSTDPGHLAVRIPTSHPNQFL